MTDNLLTWSVRNWITVILMWLVAYAVFAAGARLVFGRRAKAVDESPAGSFAPAMAAE